MEVCYWALLFMPLVILQYLYSLQIKGVSQKKKKNSHGTLLYPQKLALTSATSGGRSVGIVRSRTKATELVSYFSWKHFISTNSVISLNLSSFSLTGVSLSRHRQRLVVVVYLFFCLPFLLMFLFLFGSYWADLPKAWRCRRTVKLGRAAPGRRNNCLWYENPVRHCHCVPPTVAPTHLGLQGRVGSVG
jgi:hypothetical protein